MRTGNPLRSSDLSRLLQQGVDLLQKALRVLEIRLFLKRCFVHPA